MAKLYGSCGSIGFGGRQYKPNPDGSFDVPAEAVPVLLQHGLSTEKPTPRPETIPAEDAKRMIERIHELEGLLETERARVKELEAQLEQATAPAAPEAPVAPAADPKPKASKPKA